MAQERVDIVVTDMIASTIAPKLQQIAAAAQGAAASTAQLRAASRIATGSVARLGAQTDRTKRSFISLGRILRTMFMAYFAAAAAERIIKIADSYKEMSNRLLLVTDSAGDASKLMGALFASAQRSRTDLDATVRSFQRFDLALETMGRSQSDTLQLTETVSMMMQLTGSTSAEAASGLIQLSQAFNKGKLDGDEFRTVMETMPLVAKSFAKELGVSKTQMYAMARQGELSAKMLTDTLLASTNDVRKEFEKLDKTLSHAVTTLKNEFIFAMGELNNKLGGTDGLVKRIDSITEKVEWFSEVLLGLFNILSEAPALTNNFGLGAISDWMAPATDKLKAFREELYQTGDVGTLLAVWGKSAKLYADRLVGNLTPEEDLKRSREIVSLMQYGLDGVLAQRKAERELYKGKDRNKRVEDDRDLSALERFIEKMNAYNEVYAMQFHVRKQGLTFMQTELALRKKGTELTDAERHSVYQLIEVTRLNKQAHEEQMKIYESTVEEQGRLIAQERAAYTMRYAGIISVYELNRALYDTEASMLRVNSAMGIGNDGMQGFTNSLKLGLLQFAADVPNIMTTMADSVTEALQQMSEGVGDLVAQWAVFGESMRFIDVFRQVIASMIQQLVALATQYMVVGIARQFAGFGAGTVGAPTLPGAIQPFGTPVSTGLGFYDGGYTGGYNKQKVAGVVHGKEFVVNARATAQNRSTLEAMNAGKSVMPSVTINNNAPGVTVRAEQISKDEIVLICEETVSKRAGSAVARDMSNPNSAVSRSMRKNTTAGRKGV